ncbi:nuclear transport factor 2 family protein [Flavisolibacter ginsenosidimutans]|uniref:Nuclear transport factor 2 family protein n=1 Tax=Flavisolibacter ginsenosidimutans TaxID=661481 RepID=A0A5B8UPK3_9BACT|nr:nuclear transport factor 2 family protein [Flavisolibacter ginsenosidimutans]QEC57970.1 nuclear transport factor 2 family protein [Flavisolibacter ginsenosidimutans]
MKRILLLPAFAFIVFSFNANAQHKNVRQVKSTNAEQPYKIENNNLSIGNMAYAQKVLRAWKDFDNNTLDNSASLFAEDIVATFPDGTMIKGRDSFLKMAKDGRNSFAGVSSSVSACTTLKTPDHPESEAVAIWGMETDTNKDGTVSKNHLNEIWFFNKEGKVFEFHQMLAKDPDDKKQ